MDFFNLMITSGVEAIFEFANSFVWVTFLLEIPGIRENFHPVLTHCNQYPPLCGSLMASSYIWLSSELYFAAKDRGCIH